MPPPDSPRSRYRRLPGRMPTFRLVSNATSVLWLGDDHLLQVEATLAAERYKRFSYGDIQALLLRETARGLVYSALLGTFAAGCALLAWGMEDPGTRRVFLGLAVIGLILLAVNLFRGGTCRCQLQTAAGPHLLPSLSRRRPARRALRLITEKVEGAQITGASA